MIFNNKKNKFKLEKKNYLIKKNLIILKEN